MTDLLERLAGLDEERRRYTLDGLARHLAAANRYDRVRALFEDDGWMRARFRAGRFVYDDYLADLALAWEDGAHREALEQARSGVEAKALADCVRYALIRTSINSLAGSVPPNLVARAVETGAWPADRAMSMTTRVPDAYMRARMMAYLLGSGRLTDELQRATIPAAVTAAGEIQDSREQSYALVALAPHLTPDVVPRVLELAERLEGTEGVRVAGALAGALEGDDRQKAVELAVRLASSTSDYDRAEAWSAAAPVLDGAQLDLALRAASKLDAEGQLRALSALARRLDEPERANVFREALDAGRRMRDETLRVYALRAAVERFDDPLRQEAAQLALETALRLPPLDSEYDMPQIVGLAAAVPYLEGEHLQRATEAATRIGDIEDVRGAVVELLVMLASRVDGGQRGDLVSAALKLARAPRGEGVDEGPWEIGPLATVAPMLDGDTRAAVLKSALERALQLAPIQQSNLDWVDRRAQALDMVAPQLSAELLETALRSLQRVDDFEARTVALASLASHLADPVRTHVLAGAVRAVAEIRDSSVRRTTLSSVAPVLPDSLLAPALEAAIEIGSENERGHALAAINPRLPASLARRAFEAAVAIEFEPARSEALTSLAPALPAELVEPALEQAWATDWEPGRTQAVAALAERLQGRRRREVVESAVDAYRSREEDDMSDQMLVALAPLLTDPDLEQEGLRFADDLSNKLGAADTYAALVPNLPSDRLPALVEALPSVSSYADDVLRALAPRLVPEQLARSLDLVLAAEFELDRADGLEALAPYLGPDLLRHALEGTAAMTEDLARAVALEGLAPHLSREHLSLALETALLAEEPAMRARALAAIAPRLEGVERARALGAGLEAARAADGPWPRANSLVKLAPLVEGPERESALAGALDAAVAATGERRYRAPTAPLIELLSALEGEALATALRALVAAFLELEDPSERAHAFESIAIPHDPARLGVIREIVADSMLAARDRGRADLLEMLALHWLFAPPVLAAEALQTIAAATTEICWDWRWE